MGDQRESMNEPQPGARVTPRRAALRRIGAVGLGLAAGAPLIEWLAGCGEKSSRATPPAATATQAPQPTATPDTRPVTIAITGDVMLGRSVNTHLLASSDRFPFNGVADYLKTFDLTVGNLECVVSSLGQPEPGKQFTFEADPKAFARLSAAGFDIMSVANNHSGDYGKAAFMDMLSALPSHGVTPLGGGANLAAAHAPVIRKIRGTTVGFLAYCEIGPENFAATATTPGHSWLDPDLVRADVVATRPQVDFLIVFTHWGIEYQPQEDADQQAMARVAIDAGADLVVGAHPHIIQPSEIYKGQPIIYSLGNFVFDEMYGVEALGNVLTLTIQGSRLASWNLRQMRIGAFGQPAWV